MTKKNIYQEIACRIAQEVKKNVWGECLPGKNILAEKYKVNGRTILKALKLLEEENVIRIEPARGSFICHKTPPKITEKVVAIVESESEGDFYRKRRHYQFFSDIASSYGYKVVFIGFDAELFRENASLLLNYPVQGFYFRFGSLRKEQSLILREHGIPFSSCSRQYLDEKADYADCDHEKGMPLLLQYLRRMGHSRIGYIEFERVAEYRGYLDMMEKCFRNELKEEFDPELFLTLKIPYLQRREPGIMRGNIRNALLHLMRQKRPPSVIISNHTLLSYVREELADLIKIPEELSLAFIDYDILDDDPFLTGLSYDLEKIDACAFESLLKRVTASGVLPPRQFLIEPELKIRKSVVQGPFFKNK